MDLPVDRSITVSAPHRSDSCSLPSSSRQSLEDEEVPMFALTLVAKCLLITIGSHSGWWKLHGMTASRAATSSRTRSGVKSGASRAGASRRLNFSLPRRSTSCLTRSRHRFSRVATYAISGVTIPARAAASCVGEPVCGRLRLTGSASSGPFSPKGPVTSVR